MRDDLDEHYGKMREDFDSLEYRLGGDTRYFGEVALAQRCARLIVLETREQQGAGLPEQGTSPHPPYVAERGSRGSRVISCSSASCGRSSISSWSSSSTAPCARTQACLHSFSLTFHPAGCASMQKVDIALGIMAVFQVRSTRLRSAPLMRAGHHAVLYHYRLVQARQGRAQPQPIHLVHCAVVLLDHPPLCGHLCPSVRVPSPLLAFSHPRYHLHPASFYGVTDINTPRVKSLIFYVDFFNFSLGIMSAGTPVLPFYYFPSRHLGISKVYPVHWGSELLVSLQMVICMFYWCGACPSSLIVVLLTALQSFLDLGSTTYSILRPLSLRRRTANRWPTCRAYFPRPLSCSAHAHAY